MNVYDIQSDPKFLKYVARLGEPPPRGKSIRLSRRMDFYRNFDVLKVRVKDTLAIEHIFISFLRSSRIKSIFKI